MPVESNATGGWEQVVYLAGIGVASAVAWVISYLNGHKSEAKNPTPPTVVLEAAELTDLTEIKRLARDLKPGLERLAGALDDEHEVLRDILVRVTRLDNELEVERRVREQELLRAGRHERN